GNIDSWFGQIRIRVEQRTIRSGRAQIASNWGHCSFEHSDISGSYFQMWFNILRISVGQITTWFKQPQTWVEQLPFWFRQPQTWFRQRQTWFRQVQTRFNGPHIRVGKTRTWFGHPATWFSPRGPPVNGVLSLQPNLTGILTH